MGRFLATGLMTKISASKKEMEKGKITIDELKEKAEKSLHFDLSLYELSETDNYYIFTLKTEVLAEQLIPFLNDFLFRIGNSSEEAQEVIDKLKKHPPENWLKLAEEKSMTYFQDDAYGDPEYLYFLKDFRPSVQLNFDSILFAIEGKILMEEYGQQFTFFKYCITQTYKQYPIATALRIYITG